MIVGGPHQGVIGFIHSELFEIIYVKPGTKTIFSWRPFSLCGCVQIDSTTDSQDADIWKDGFFKKVTRYLCFTKQPVQVS